MSRHPLFQVLVGWEEADGTLLADGVTFLEVDSAAEQFDIALELRPKANQIEAALSYSIDVSTRVPLVACSGTSTSSSVQRLRIRQRQFHACHG